MLKPSFYLAAMLICGIALLFIRASTTPFILITGAMIGIAVPLLDSLAENSRYLRPIYYSLRYAGRHIRLSVSYLFRIKVDGAYLLVRSARWDHYQPVGGVYKISEGAKSVMDELGILDDSLVPIDEASLHDLRIRVPARRLVQFIRWFESERSRETSSWREFSEELLKPEILSYKDFPFIFSDYIRREVRPIRFSSYAQSMELFISDIYELLPTPEQLVNLRALKDKGHPDVLWATEDQIRRLGAEPGKGQPFKIGEPATWIL
jgi:hypothetical protein